VRPELRFLVYITISGGFGYRRVVGGSGTKMPAAAMADAKSDRLPTNQSRLTKPITASTPKPPAIHNRNTASESPNG